MNAKSLLKGALALGATTCSLSAAVVNWDAGGNGSSWNDPLNWSGDVVPVQTDLNNDQLGQINGGNIVVDSGTNAVVGKIENGGLTGGSLTVNSGGSLDVAGSLEINRKDGNSLLDVNGGSVDNTGGTTFITHFIDATTPEDPTEGSLTVRNGGTFTTNSFRSDGGVSNLNISGAGSTVNANATHNRFANNDSATAHLTMSDGTLNTSFRDYWGGVGATMNISGGTYNAIGDQLLLAGRAGGDTTVVLSGGSVISDGNVYLANGVGTTTTVTQTGGLFETTHASRDLRFAEGAGTTVSYTISGGTLRVEDQTLMNQSGASSKLIDDGTGGTIDLNGHLEASSANATLGFILEAGGVSVIDVEGNFNINNATLMVDLANYNDANGDVQIGAYTGNLGGAFGTLDIQNGTATLDTSVANQIWLRDIVSVPEPSSLLLLGLAGLACSRRRRS